MRANKGQRKKEEEGESEKEREWRESLSIHTVFPQLDSGEWNRRAKKKRIKNRKNIQERNWIV